MDNTNKAYIIGHRNPDMDSIAAALGSQEFLRLRVGVGR